MKCFYSKISVIHLILFMQFTLTDLNAQISYSPIYDYFREVHLDIYPLMEEVNTGYGNQRLQFHSYYGVLNEHQVNRRTAGQLRNYATRVELYENLIDEILAQNELSPFYLLMDRVAEFRVRTVEEKILALSTIAPLIGLRGELHDAIDNIIEIGYDAPIGAAFSLLEAGLTNLDQLHNLPILGEAAAALDGLGIGLSYYSVANDAEKLAMAFTLFMALDLEVYRMRLESLKHNATIEDPAFWTALHETESRLHSINRSHWARIYQFAIENGTEMLDIVFRAGIATAKIALKSVASSVLPWAGAAYFSYGQFRMVKDHWQSLAYGTLAGTLYHDLEGKDVELQSYLGYVYLRERKNAFNNWTTHLFSFLNFRTWNEVLREFDRGLNQYKSSWMQHLMNDFLRGGVTLVEREHVLNICDVWSVANSGGVEGTIDRWDITELPEGALLDIRYDTRRIPDKITVEYPEGYIQLDTGWRGDRNYTGPNYPGGIAGPGVGQQLGIFRKDGINQFIVRVFGVDNNTIWDYSVRCRSN